MVSEEIPYEKYVAARRRARRKQHMDLNSAEWQALGNPLQNARMRILELAELAFESYKVDAQTGSTWGTW